MRKRVEKARNMQEKRFAGLSIRCNSEMGPAEIREFCSLLPEDEGVSDGRLQAVRLQRQRV